MNLQDICDKGVKEFKSNNFVKAIELFEQLPLDPSIKFFIAQSYWKTGDYQSGLENFKKAYELNPNELQLCISLVKSYIAEYRYQEALEVIKKQNATHPNNAFLMIYELLINHQKLTDISQNNLSELFRNHPSDKTIIELNHVFQRFSPDTLTQIGGSSIYQPNFVLQSSLNEIKNRSEDLQLLSLPKDVLKVALDEVSIDGMFLEMGVYFAQSINISAKLKPTKTFYGFDSFNGLPEDWKEGELSGSYSTDNQLPKVESNVQLIKGWFKDTLPPFFEQHSDAIAFLHIDCDIYSSTQDVFKCCADRIQSGTVILFDDFFGYEGFKNHELKAFDEYLQSSGMSVEYLACCPLGRELAVKVK